MASVSYLSDSITVYFVGGVPLDICALARSKLSSQPSETAWLVRNVSLYEVGVKHTEVAFVGAGVVVCN